MGATTSMIYSGAVDATVGTVVNGAVSSIASTYEMQEELDVTLYSLQQEVMKIQCAINVARRRRITDRQLLMWLTLLIDAVYLGHYYHRTFKRHNSHSQMITREDASNLAISPYYPAAKRRRTIKTLIFGDKEIRELYNTVKKLKSIDVGAFMLMVNGQPEWPIRTYLYMDHNRLFGRDKEREQVMNFLFKPSTAGENNVDILPIIGSKGGGKTSLALYCFNDSKVQSHFSLKIYDKFYSISSSPDENNFCGIFRQLLNRCNVTNITSDDENTPIVMLKQILSSERILLIMDDVLCVDSRTWNALWDCLRCGKQGSKVILISMGGEYRNYKKIVNPGEAKPVAINGFSEDEYMSFFEQHAFGSIDPDDYPDLIEIGRKIAEELGGSIWGAKIFGELLRDNLNAEFWTYFLQDCLLNSKKKLQQKDLFAVLKVIFPLLLKRPPPTVTWGLSLVRRSDGELKSYRELLVLGPDHCKPSIKNGRNYLQFLLTEHIFLNECTLIRASFEF